MQHADHFIPYIMFNIFNVQAILKPRVAAAKRNRQAEPRIERRACEEDSPTHCQRFVNPRRLFSGQNAH